MGIGSVVGFDPGETDPYLEIIVSIAGAIDRACEEESGLLKTRECVPRGSKELCPIPWPPYWEGGVDYM